MPTVPTYQQGQVNERPLPTPGSAGPGPIEAYGGGPATARANEEVGGVGNVLFQISMAEKEKARDMATTEYAARIASEETRSKVAISQVRGKNALDAVEQGLGDFDKFYTKLEEEIDDPEIKRRLRFQYLRNRESLDSSGQIYAAGQVREYDNQQSLALIEAQGERVSFEPSNIDLMNEAQKTAAQASAGLSFRNGESPEVAALRAQKIKSGLYASAISALVDKGKDREASGYFARVSDFLTEGDRKALTRVLQDGTVLGDAYRYVDEWFAPHGVVSGVSAPQEILQEPPTMADINTLASKIEDSKTRKMATDLARQRISDTEHAQNQYWGNRTQFWTTQMRDKNNYGKPPAAIVPTSEWAVMPEKDRGTLESVYNPPVDDDRWMGWIALRDDPRKMAAMDTRTFYNDHWRYLTKEHRTKAEADYEKAKKGETFAFESAWQTRALNLAASVGAFGLTKADTIKSLEKIPNEERAIEFSKFADRLETAFGAFYENNNQHNPTPDEQRKIMFDVMKGERQVFLPEATVSVEAGGDRKGRFKRFSDLTNAERREFVVTLESLLPEEIVSIKTALKAANVPQTPVAISAYYRAYLEDDDAMRDFILSGRFFEHGGDAYRGR